MDAFSYLSVLVSIVLGLGMTQILTAAGRLIRARDTVIVYWPSLVWAAVLMVIHVQVWWTLFGLRDRATWSFIGFLAVLLMPIVLYMLSALVLPEGVEATHDLRAHYERHSPWFFGFLVAALVVSILKDLVLQGRLPEPVNLGFHISLLIMWGLAIFVRRAWYHQLLAAGSVVGVTVYISLLFSQLR